MKKIIFCVIVICLFTMQNNFAQVKKYGKVSAFELKKIQNEKFKDENAVVLFKKRRTFYEEADGKFILKTEIHERIKLYNKDAFDIASKKIRFYTKGYSKENVYIKAATYNLDGEKVVKTKLKKKDVFEEKESKFYTSKNFTMPNLKEGCIIEWKYTITSPYYTSINDAIFQYDIPIKHYDAQIKIPEHLIFKTKPSYYYSTKIKEYKKNGKIFRSKGNIELSETVFEIKLTDIPALKQEPFINNINNYRGKVKFELIATNNPNSTYKSYSTTWNDVTKSVYNLSSFGFELKKKKYFKDDLNEILSRTSSNDEKINEILSFVKTKIKWNQHNGYTTHQGVKKAFKTGIGNVAEINLTLTAMLREAGINANPVLVSTRSHGIPLFPTIDGFNYVITGIELLNDIILLDATDPFSLPNILPKRALNWQGRMIREQGSSKFINLFSKVYSLETKKLTVKINDDEESIYGFLRDSYKNFIALRNRNKYNNLSEENLIEKLESKYSPIEIEKIRAGNQTDLNKPLSIDLQYEAKNQVEKIGDKLYFSPLFFLKETENIFKSETRNFPIDFVSAWLDKYEIIIQIPSEYVIEKTPEDLSIDTENGFCNFSYKIVVKENKIIVNVMTKINTSIIPYSEYLSLKEFYSKKILKENEKVVLIKK